MKGPIIYKEKPVVTDQMEIVDLFYKSIRELFYIRNQSIKKSPIDDDLINQFIEQNNFFAIWIYYPWHNKLIKSVDEKLYFELRTDRNRNLITSEEQLIFRQSTVGIIGLSVGSATAIALAFSGGPKTMRLADFDEIEITNLNRIKANLQNIGENKAILAAKSIWDIDPFADLGIWSQGVSVDTIEDFLTKPKKLDFFIDAMDSIELKIVARLYCKKYGIPVLMATDNGNCVILDIERYDLDKQIYPFHGLLGKLDWQNYSEVLKDSWLEISSKIVDVQLLEERMIESVKLFGTSLVGIPQLGTTSDIAGSLTTLVIRDILNKKNLSSGRYLFSFTDINNYKII